jgi:hypothetical protein
MKDVFQENRIEREKIGTLYRSIDKTYGDVATVLLLDPRNLLSILVYFFRQIKRRQINIRTALMVFLTKIKREAVFVNGNYVEKNLDEVIEKYIKESRNTT